MRWTSLLAIYVLFWAFSVFLVLPWGVRTTHEAGAEHVPGTAESAPHEFSVGRIAVRVTIVATVLWGLFVLNYEYGWVGASALDLFDPANRADLNGY
jgi:predicted secreted protein